MSTGFGRISQFPVLFPLSQYIFGVVLGLILRRAWPWSWLFLVASLSVLLPSFVFRRQTERFRIIASSFFLIWLGIYQFATAYEGIFRGPRLDIRYPRRVEGVINGYPVFTSGKTSFTVAVDTLDEKERSADERFIARIYLPESSLIEKGERVEILAGLKPLKGFYLKGPLPKGGKDRPRFKGVLKSDVEVHTLKGPGPIDRLLNFSLARIRRGIPADFDRDARGVLSGTMWGDKKGISRQMMRDYKAAGLVHILVVSGFNIGLVFAFFFFSVRTLLSRSTGMAARVDLDLLSTALAFWPALLYAMMTGLPYPTLRAVLMLLAFIAALVMARPSAAVNLLFWVAFLIILFDPLSLFDISMELSFAAVFGIVFGMGKFRNLYTGPAYDDFSKRGIACSVARKTRIYFLDLFCSSLFAFLFTVPISVYYFGSFSTVSVLANLFFVPVFSLFIFPVGMLGMIASVVGVPAASFLWRIDLFAVKIVNSLISLTGKIPGSLLKIEEPSLGLVAFYYIGLIICVTLVAGYFKGTSGAITET